MAERVVIAPPGIHLRERIFVALIFVLAVTGAILFAASEKQFANAHFEFGKPRHFVGIGLPGAFPVLLSPDSAGSLIARSSIVGRAK